jgi:hypothetical protein
MGPIYKLGANASMTVKTVDINKSRIAVIQLRKAIQLYNKRDFICAVTLAGAADDILGGLAFHRHGYNTLDNNKWFWDEIAQEFSKDKPSKNKIKKVNNKVKNNLKHHDNSVDIVVSADFEFEAQCIIDSAIRNYWIAFDTFLQDRVIKKYVDQNWT